MSQKLLAPPADDLPLFNWQKYCADRPPSAVAEAVKQDIAATFQAAPHPDSKFAPFWHDAPTEHEAAKIDQAINIWREAVLAMNVVPVPGRARFCESDLEALTSDWVTAVTDFTDVFRATCQVSGWSATDVKGLWRVRKQRPSRYSRSQQYARREKA